MEFEKLFLPVEHFPEELFSPLASSHLLTRTHLLLESINGTSFLLAVSENSLTFVKLSIDKLPLKKLITVALLEHLGISLHVAL